MAFQIIRKDFLPVGIYDGSQYREKSMRYSYTGKEFDSIVGYLITNGIDEFWATQEDINELFPLIEINDIPDATGFNSHNQVITIFNRLVELGDDIDEIIKRIQNYINHPIINDYMDRVKNQFFD